MSSFNNEDWRNVIGTTYKVVKSSSWALDGTLAATLGIKGLYEVSAVLTMIDEGQNLKFGSKLDFNNI